MNKQDYNDGYNAGLDTAASIVEEMLGGTAEGETILCGIESSKKTITMSEEIRSLICDPKNYPEDALQCQIDSESPYCAKCGSCGETGCCPPINCEEVVCKYGKINLKDYRCFQDQWEVMYNALKIIVEECGGGKIGDYAKETLNEVDKLWDKLYSKE